MLARPSPSNWLQVLALYSLALLSCSDDPAAPEEEPTESNVSVESSNREAATIGANGGSVSTTSDAGVTYTLDVPANALPGDVEIAITPVTAISNLPFDGRLEGAVRLQPSGLELLKPATLTIARDPSTSGAERLVGFAYQGDATSFEPTVAIDGMTEVRVLVSHFSGAGAASSSDPEVWLAALCASAPTLDYPFAGQLDICWTSSVSRRDWFFEFARDYLADIVAPAVGNTGTLTVGVREYIEWRTGCEELAEPFEASDWATVMASEIEIMEEIIATELVAAVAGEKSALCSQGGPAHLRSLFEYRHLAMAAEFDDVTGLRAEDILDGLCAEVRIAELTLADPMPMNQGTSLDARAELWINDQREDGMFRFTVSPATANATCGAGETVCGGNSNGFGEYTQVVTRTGPGLVEIGVFASLLVSLDAGSVGTWVESPLLGSDTVEREDYSIAATFPVEVETNQAVTLTAVVTRDNDTGSPQPIEGAIVTFVVDGGTADPTQGTTNASGSVSTQVTANDGPNRVVIDMVAFLNGEQIATKTVEAAIEQPSPTGTLALLSRTTQVLAWVPDLSECTGDAGGETQSTALGQVSVTEDANMSCSNEFGTGQGQTRNQHVSDPGFATDGRSALLYFFTSASASAQATGDYKYEAQFVGNMQAVFQVLDGTATYEIEATFNGTVGDISVSLAGGSTSVVWTKKPGDGHPNTFTASGTLATGAYAATFGVVGAVASDISPSSGSCGITATIRLTAAPAATTSATNGR